MSSKLNLLLILLCFFLFFKQLCINFTPFSENAYAIKGTLMQIWKSLYMFVFI